MWYCGLVRAEIVAPRIDLDLNSEFGIACARKHWFAFMAWWTQCAQPFIEKGTFLKLEQCAFSARSVLDFGKFDCIALVLN